MKIDLGLIAFISRPRDMQKNVVGRPEIQKFLGSLVGRGATKGVFVTTSKFSGEAIEFAHHISQRVILIDGNRLADLMIEYGVGCTIKTTMELKQVDENFFLTRKTERV
jgi:restriction system protein